jgi:hypothetical protein
VFSALLVISLPDMYKVWSSYCTYPAGCQSLTPQQGEALARIGVSMEAWGYFLCTVATLFYIGAVSISAIFIWSRVNTLMVQLVGFTTLGLAITASGLFQVLSMKYPDMFTLLVWVAFFYFGFGISFIFFLIPNGRFQPGWVFWLGVLTILDNLYHIFWARDGKGTLLETLFWVIDIVSLYAFFPVAILRYFRYSNPLEKRQIKIIFYCMVFFYITEFGIGQYFPQWFRVLTDPNNYYFVLQSVAAWFGCMLAWSGFVIAIFRANFLDIDTQSRNYVGRVKKLPKVAFLATIENSLRQQTISKKRGRPCQIYP